MQIVLNTLQTDSGDQPGSSCLSQKQKIKGDLGSWAKKPSPSCGLCTGPGGGVPGGAETHLGFSVGGGGTWAPVLSTLNAPLPVQPLPGPEPPLTSPPDVCPAARP